MDDKSEDIKRKRVLRNERFSANLIALNAQSPPVEADDLDPDRNKAKTTNSQKEEIGTFLGQSLVALSRQLNEMLEAVDMQSVQIFLDWDEDKYLVSMYSSCGAWMKLLAKAKRLSQQPRFIEAVESLDRNIKWDGECFVEAVDSQQ